MAKPKSKKPEAPPKLTNKQLAFIGYYLRSFNATESAILAGYSKETAGSIGSENLTKPEIRTEIDKHIQAHLMSADEVLIRMSDIARGDIAQLMDISGMGFNLDMQRAKDAGLTKLIKRVKQKTTTYIAKSESEEDREVTELEIDLYDAQSALVTIGKQHGLFSTKVEIKDWRDEARKAGYNPEELFNDLVEAARRKRAEVDGAGGSGSDSGSGSRTAPDGRAGGDDPQSGS